MKIEDAVKMLQESNGSHVYEIHIPSAGKKVKFKPITTGQQKSLAKFSLDAHSFNLNYEILKLGLFDELKIDKDQISSDKLKEIDLIAFLAGLRMYNIIDVMQITAFCFECQDKFIVDINLNNIIDRCSKYEFDEYKYSNSVDEIEYEIVVAEPSYKNIIELEEYVKLMSEKLKMTPEDRIELRAFTKPAIYLSEVKINGALIDNFKHSDFTEKLKLYNSLPPKITFIEKDSILNLIIDKFDLEANEKMLGNVTCPKCKKELEGVITNDSFFII